MWEFAAFVGLNYSQMNILGFWSNEKNNLLQPYNHIILIIYYLTLILWYRAGLLVLDKRFHIGKEYEPISTAGQHIQCEKQIGLHNFIMFYSDSSQRECNFKQRVLVQML